MSRNDDHAYLLGELAEVKNRLARLERERAKEKTSEAIRDEVDQYLCPSETYSVSPDIRKG